MRRGSIIGPLILIALGILFLLRNVWPDIPVFELLSRYWPFLLIGWGVIRLFEIFIWASQSKPIPRQGISSGEWTWIILICVVGLAAHTAHRFVTSFPSGRAWRGVVMNMGENYDYTLSSVSEPCPANCRVLIESFRGNAKITGSPDNEVRATGSQRIRSFQKSDADNANRQTPFELVRQGDQLIVRTNQDKVSDRLRVSADLEITVPAGASIEAHGRSGDFDIQNVNGNIDVNSDNAGVRLDNIGGNVRLDLRRSDSIRATQIKGNLDLKGRGQDVMLENIAGQVTLSGTYVGQVDAKNLAHPLRYTDSRVTLSLEKLPGEMHLSLGDFNAENVIGPIRLDARSSDVHLSEFTDSLDLELQRGDVTLRPAKAMPKIDVHTRSGDVDLALPEGAHFDLRASTNHGDIRNDFGSPLTVSQSPGRASISGSTGGGAQVRIETNRGDIAIRKATGADAPAPLRSHLPSSSDQPLHVQRQ